MGKICKWRRFCQDTRHRHRARPTSRCSRSSLRRWQDFLKLLMFLLDTLSHYKTRVLRLGCCTQILLGSGCRHRRCQPEWHSSRPSRALVRHHLTRTQCLVSRRCRRLGLSASILARSRSSERHLGYHCPDRPCQQGTLCIWWPQPQSRSLVHTVEHHHLH